MTCKTDEFSNTSSKAGFYIAKTRKGQNRSLAHNQKNQTQNWKKNKSLNKRPKIENQKGTKS